jgi:tRNA dimethylallyltransferase
MTATASQIGNTARVWLIAGPTASGKSALALDLARQWDAEIVNADALQIYADLRILTARPSPTDEAARPHHLYGVADAADAWSVGRWLAAARAVLDDIAARDRIALVVGGTGLYFRALTEGLADIPPVTAAVRAEARAAFDRLGEAALRHRLGGVDPAAAARIAPGDRQRLTRAWEVWLATGRSLSDWQRATPPGLGPRAWLGLILEPPRATLYRHSDHRLTDMVADGALDEVRRLMSRGLPADRPALKALGFQALAAQVAGDLSLEAALEAARLQTRHYIKRQSTWFRTQTANWQKFTNPKDLNHFLSLRPEEAAD